MSHIPEGWYPDPGATGSDFLRWWSGTQWTDHTADAPPQTSDRPPFLADGTPLASWGARVGASLIDTAILLPMTVLLTVPFWGRIAEVLRDYFDQVQRAAEQGGPQPDAFALQRELFGTSVAVGAIGLAFGLVWTFFWLRWKQATPGKLVLGLRIRRRDTPGQLPWGTIGRRWLLQGGPGVLGVIPIVGSLASLFSILDSLWPLWDEKRQALHDKWARTNVVKHVRGPDPRV